MKIRMLLALAGLTVGLITPAFSQTTAKDLVGAWTLVSLTLEKDGTKTDLYGPNPRGLFIRDANNHVVVVITRADLPKFAANNRTAGTAEEKRLSCRAVLLTLVATRWMRRPRSLPPISRDAHSQIGSEPTVNSPSI
jgi:Lipocalin-like domain